MDGYLPKTPNNPRTTGRECFTVLMTKIKVQYYALDTLANDIDLAVIAIDLDLGDLATYVGQLTAQWEGEAAEAYAAAQRRWDEAAKDLRDTLVAVSGQLTDASNTFETTEAALAQAW